MFFHLAVQFSRYRIRVSLYIGQAATRWTLNALRYESIFRSLAIPENDTGSRRLDSHSTTPLLLRGFLRLFGFCALALLQTRSRLSVSTWNELPGFPFCSLPRKEVIQPHLPIRLPCYDFTPVISLTFDGCFLAVGSPASGAPNSHGVTGGVYKARERIHRGMLIRDY